MHAALYTRDHLTFHFALTPQGAKHWRCRTIRRRFFVGGLAFGDTAADHMFWENVRLNARQKAARFARNAAIKLKRHDL